MLSPTECSQHLTKAAVPIPVGMEAIPRPSYDSERTQSHSTSCHTRAVTQQQVLHNHPAELWRTTINLSASDAGLFFCTLSTSGIYCIHLWKGCLYHLCQTLSKFTSLSNSSICSYCRFVFTVLRVTHHDRTKLKFTLSCSSFSLPSIHSSYSPQSPLITTRFSSSCLEP